RPLRAPVPSLPFTPFVDMACPCLLVAAGPPSGAGYANRSGIGMAKTCEVCKQPYPDELESCPHCVGVKTMKVDDLAMMAEVLGLAAPPQPMHVDPPSDVGLKKEQREQRPPQSQVGDVNQMAAWLFNQGQGPRPPAPPLMPEPPPDAAFLDSGEP